MLASGVNTDGSPDWADLIPRAQRQIYTGVVQALNQEHVPFAVGGAFALASHTGFYRNTNDLDLFIERVVKDNIIEILGRLGLSDLYEQREYDRKWIYRAFNEQTIVDVIWAMPNDRACIDSQWINPTQRIKLFGEDVNVVPVEELIWAKLFVLQRERCDWTDILNLVYAKAATLNWNHLLNRIGDDRGLFAGLMAVFQWLCPGRASAVPPAVWREVGLAPPAAGPEIDERRVRLLDSRPWFFANFQHQHFEDRRC